MPEPSLFQLFRRSKYSRFEFSDAPATDHNRRELFAVAALGFVLKHDLNFRAHFLRTICNEAQLGADEFEINCEDRNCADLALLHRAKKACYIVEAKVKAPLVGKQNPLSREFVPGYAKQIEEAYGKFTQIFYITLRESGEFKARKVSRTHCSGRNWAHINDRLSSSPLVDDLLNTLGKLQISAFELRNFDKKSMRQHTPPAAEMLRFFIALAKSLEVSEKKVNWDVSADTDRPYFGIEITCQSARLKKLKTKAGRNLSLWLGYDIKKRGVSPEPMIWFYCDNKSEYAAARKLVMSDDVKEVRYDGFSFAIRPAKRPRNEAEWFVSKIKILRS